MNRFTSKIFKSTIPPTTKMPAFTLYGARGSTNTDRVRLTLAEGGMTDYETVFLDFHKGEVKTPQHIARHPMGKVPAISFPNGFSLCESRPICKYLARKYSMPLLPPSTDIEATAKFEEAESLETSYFAAPAGKIAFETFVKKMLCLPKDEAAVKAAVKELEAFLDVANGIIQKQEYFAGKDFSLVDIYYLPLVQRLFVCGYEHVFKSRPAVNAWLDRCMSRPAVREIIQAGQAPASGK